MRKTKRIGSVLSVLFGVALAAACGGGNDANEPGPTTDADASSPFGEGGGACEVQCGATCCAAGERCANGVRCTPIQKPCQTADDCLHDSYCANGTCTPYGVPPEVTNDPTCKATFAIDAIVPAVQCQWSGPPAGDPKPDNVQVMATPVVVDFDLDHDPKTLSPSIVFPSFTAGGGYKVGGVLRVISGEDCHQQDSLPDPDDAVMSPAPLAVGDLEGDGVAEIVAAGPEGGVLAFRFDPTTKKLARMWRSGTCTGGVPPATPDATGGSNRWSGPSIADLDDDGAPEIIYGGVVYSGANGCLKSQTLGILAYSAGVVPVVADVDEDGKAELVTGNGIYEWKGGDWVAETYFVPGTLTQGQVAVADMGNFPLASLGGKDFPEVVVVSAGNVRVQTLEGTVVFGPFAIPGGGSGGPPTIADFDGDGRRELATAGGGNYVVFDLDCVAGGDPKKCGGASKTDGVLWAQPSQDLSSNVTGSSVFDFDANGSAEAVYADECYLRIYEGATGKVLFSAARASGTTYENPVIVDADGDYRTEIVTALNDYGDRNCAATDPLYPSAKFTASHGVAVLRDEKDRWAPSRPVWNQHAYAVTNVGDNGSIPKTSAVKPNWRDPTLNNFRQNVQGGLEAFGQPDLTAGGEIGAVKCNGGVASVEARVCNRGTLPMVRGTEVAFHDGADATGPILCTTPVPVALAVSECFTVSCQADLGGKTHDVFVEVDPKGQAAECHEHNNATLYRGVACGLVPR
ncbi:MAG: hypothetical protein U0235_02735 [Polyangiaceae bacterium]